MEKYFLDTNVIIDAMKGKNANIMQHFLKVPSSSIYVPAIVLAELEFGAKHSGFYEITMKKTEEFIRPFKIINFSSAEAYFYGIIRQQLSVDGKLIGPNDMLIAAITMTNNEIMVTHNTDEFSRIKGLQIEDWAIN